MGIYQNHPYVNTYHESCFTNWRLGIWNSEKHGDSIFHPIYVGYPRPVKFLHSWSVIQKDVKPVHAAVIGVDGNITI